jgi:undecaprenyl phosphate-alpha-L-ara4N flippase subunit ArnE
MSLAALGPAAAGLLAFCVVGETAQQISFKLGADRAGALPGWVGAILRQPLIWTGIAIWAVETTAWVLVLQRLPLSVAYPMMTLSYATVPMAGLFLLKERMSRRKLAGAGLIFAGVALVGLAGG